MLINTTITAEKDGITLFETDVICCIEYTVDRRHNELEWNVQEYLIEEKRRTWDDTAGKWTESKVQTAVPEKLAEVFDEYLDHDWIDERVRERLADYGDDRGDYLRDLAMDR
jgi:hypothetical protein